MGSIEERTKVEMKSLGDLHFIQKEAEKQRKRRNAAGRDEISFGCDKADMHIKLRHLIQLIGEGKQITHTHTAN